MTDQIDQIEKPMCSVATDQTRLRRATALLPASQAAVSSGSQSWMTRDLGAVSWRKRLGLSGTRVGVLGDAATLPFVRVPVLFPVVVLTVPPWFVGRCESVTPTLETRCCPSTGKR